MNTYNTQKSEGGFTLVELLGVVCILLVLVKVALFAIDGAKERGREAAIARAEQTLNSSVQTYLAAGGSTANLPDDDYIAASDEMVRRLEGTVNVSGSEVGPFLASQPKISLRKQGLWLRLQWISGRFKYFTAGQFGWNPEREDGQP